MISVIINNHNYGEYIGQAIESVLSQNFRDFEVVIVDGASSDSSREIIYEYVTGYPDRITSIMKTTSGQAAAINAGFAVCRGDIIALLDSDDCFLPGKLEKIALLHQKYDFVGTACKRSDGKNHDIPKDNADNRQMLLRKYGFIYTYELTTSCISMSRRLAEQILPMPEENYVTYADAYIKVLAQYQSNIYFCDEPYSLYRIHERNTMASSKKNKEMNIFLSKLYQNVFENINERIKKAGLMPIPFLGRDNYKKAFCVANPRINLVKGKNYAIYGVGLNSYRLLRLKEIFSIDFVFAIDSDPNKQGGYWEGIKIISSQEAIDRRSEFEQILIGATFYNEISRSLVKQGLVENEDFIGNIVINDY